MNYIVFDLEWNQGFEKDMNNEIPFEIIEIASVKLNENYEIIDNFEQIIKPEVYKNLYPVTRELTGFTEKELEKGISFLEAVTKFLDWCGEEYIFCTWSTQDLKELQMNMRYYGSNLVDTPPLFYYDIQKLFSYACENGDDRRSLKYAVEYLNIEESVPFHRAYGDAYYTAMVMKSISFEEVKDYISVDTFVIPKEASEELRLEFDNYSKYISRGFESKELLLSAKGMLEVRCHKCGKMVKRKINWFSDGIRNFYFAGRCKEHGKIKGKLRIRQSVEGKFYAIKTIKTVSDEEFEEIVQKKKMKNSKKKK